MEKSARTSTPKWPTTSRRPPKWRGLKLRPRRPKQQPRFLEIETCFEFINLMPKICFLCKICLFTTLHFTAFNSVDKYLNFAIKWSNLCGNWFTTKFSNKQPILSIGNSIIFLKFSTGRRITTNSTPKTIRPTDSLRHLPLRHKYNNVPLDKHVDFRLFWSHVVIICETHVA